MSYSQWGLKKKLNSANITTAVFIALMTVINFWGFKKIISEYDVIAEEIVPKIQSIGEMKGAMFSASTQVTLLSLDNVSSDQRKEWEEELEERLERFEKAFQNFKSLNLDQEELAFFEQINKDWQKFKNASLKVKELKKNNNSANNAEVKSLITVDIETQLNELYTKFNELTDDVNVDMKEASLSADQHNTSNTLTTSTLALITISFTFVLGILNRKSIEKSILDVIEHLTNSSDKVAAGSQSVAAAATELSSITNTQSAALDQTSTASAQINSMIEKNVELLKESKNLSETSFNKGLEGQEAMGHLLQSIEHITEGNSQIETQVSENNKKMEDIIKAIATINERTKVINDIVFQTKLLSFNASVEAARAGEAGKGFAVVAEEVGNLAQMSGKASQDISQLLESSSQQVKEIIQYSQAEIDKLMGNSKKNIEQGVQISQQCAHLIEEMVEQSKQILSLSESIDTASSEQAKGVHEIAKAISSLSHSNNEILAASDSSAHSSETLSKEAIELNNFVEDLSRVVFGASYMQTQPHFAKSQAKEIKLNAHSKKQFKKVS